MPQVLRLDGAATKVEGTYGVDAVPSLATDGVKIAGRLWPTITLDYEWENTQEDVASGSIVRAASALPRGRKIMAEIPWLMRGAGAAYSGGARAEADALWRGAGYAATVVANTVEYVQASTAHESFTAYLYAGGYLFKAVGCRAAVRWPFAAGRLGIMPIRIFGMVTTAPAVTALPAITYDAQEPIASVGMALTIGAYTPNVISGEFNQGVDPQLLEDANAADGIEQFDYGDAAPTLQLLIRSAIATFDPYVDHNARTAKTINLTHGQTALDRVKLQITSDARIVRAAHQAAKGFTTWDLGYEIGSSYKLITD